MLEVVPGGSTRTESALAGVEAATRAPIVLVHDGVRPFVDPALVAAVLDAVRRHGAAIPALPALETVKRDDGAGFVAEQIARFAVRAGRALGVPMPLHEELYAALAGKAS